MIKKIRLLFQDFLVFFRQDFHPGIYLYTFLFLIGVIVAVYGTGWGTGFGKGFVPVDNRLFNFLLRYGGLYYLVAIPLLIVKREFAILLSPRFYIKSGIFIFLLSFTDHISWRSLIDLSSYPQVEQAFVFKVLARSRNLLFILPALVCMRLFFDKKIKGLYGLCRGSHHVKAYMSLYLLIIPLLIYASFTPDFLSYYPNYKPWVFKDVFGCPSWLNTLLFESLYMADFIMVELFFRGVLVIGMATILGRNAVLPMVAVYVALHFGKPALETVSAIFGGYFLGALAFQTRHIWGGVIIHMGIALLIELLRFFEHYILDVG